MGGEERKGRMRGEMGGEEGENERKDIWNEDRKGY